MEEITAHKVDLTSADDNLEGYWWNRIRVRDFAFAESIYNQEQADAEEGDIFIHKQILEGERYPTTSYHVVLDGELILIDGKEAREQLAAAWLRYYSENGEHPFKCFLNKVQKNKVITIKYSPTPYDNFLLKIPISSITLPNEIERSNLEKIEEFFSNLPQNSVNGLVSGDFQYTIDKLENAGELEKIAQESGNQKVFVFNGKISKIDKRKNIFQGNVNIYYVLEIKDGKAAPDKKKNTLKRDFNIAIAKASKNAKDKFDLNVGDVISFNGKFKYNKELGWVIQNIRKFEKTEINKEANVDNTEKEK